MLKEGSSTVDGLADKIGVSSMGVRQHLAILEKNGYVTFKQLRRPIGRPCYLYELTEKAENIFPKTYERFALDTLNFLKEADGEKKVNLIFKSRMERIYRDHKDRFKQKKLNERVKTLSKFLEESGVLNKFRKDKQEIYLTIYNCPLYQIAKSFPQLCNYDLQTYANLLNARVKLLQTQIKNNNYCEFMILEDGR